MFHILFLHRLSEFNQLPRASWTVCQCTREYYKGTVLICRVLRYWISFPFHVWCRFHLFRLSSPGYVHADTWEDDLLLFRRVAWLSVCVCDVCWHVEGNPCVCCQTQACFSPPLLSCSHPPYGEMGCGYHGTPNMSTIRVFVKTQIWCALFL